MCRRALRWDRQADCVCALDDSGNRQHAGRRVQACLEQGIPRTLSPKSQPARAPASTRRRWIPALRSSRSALSCRLDSIVRNRTGTFPTIYCWALRIAQAPQTGVVRFPSFLCDPSFPQAAPFRRGSFLVQSELLQRRDLSRMKIIRRNGNKKAPLIVKHSAVRRFVKGCRPTFDARSTQPRT
ncbi:hypothetical protein ACVINI_005011 [Rhizobium beringeri]